MPITVGIVSDTHGRISASVTKHLSSCDIILHAGDYQDPMQVEQLSYLSEKSATVYAVRGNCDWDNDFPREIAFDADGLRFFLSHGDRFIHRSNAWDTAIAIGSLIHPLGGSPKRPDIVVFGHLHVTMNFQYQDVLFLNPGSPVKPRRGSKAAICILTLENGSVKDIQFIEV